MKTEWKQSGIDRRDCRATKESPEAHTKGKPSQKPKKPISIYRRARANADDFFMGWAKVWHRVGRYKNMAGANAALESFKLSDNERYDWEYTIEDEGVS